MYTKRRNFRRNDPRALFQSVYSQLRKRAPSPRDLFSSVYSNYGYDKRYNNDGGLGMANYGDYKRSAFRKNDPRSLFRSVYGYLR
jgi:hypothetical protein